MENSIQNEDLLALVKSKIYTIRGQKVMLDFDLAAMYGVETYYVLKLHCNLMITSLGRR